LLAKTNETGELVKQRFGPLTMTAFRWLARLKGLRGTEFDVFGRTPERRQERDWIQRYQAMLQEVCGVLTSSQAQTAVENYKNALSLAQIPQDIRGFGHVKARHSAQAMEKWQQLLVQFRVTSTP
jgi:indolepyruvate ferredoxin oxidoreductase